MRLAFSLEEFLISIIEETENPASAIITKGTYQMEIMPRSHGTKLRNMAEKKNNEDTTEATLLP